MFTSQLTGYFGPAITNDCKLALYKTVPKNIQIPGNTQQDTELFGGAYARTDIIWGEPTTEENGTQIVNTEDVLFEVATEDLGQVLYYAIYSTSNSLLFYGLLDTPVYWSKGGQVKIPAGDLILRFLFA